MGVSAQDHRVRTGLHAAFYCITRNTPQVSNNGSIGLTQLLLPTILLVCLMLVASGIEPNPGPAIVCEICQCSFNSVKCYVVHQNVHRSVKNRTIRCLNENCFSTFSNFKSLKTHMSRDHRKIAVADVVSFNCPVESCLLPKNEKDLNSHLATHLDNGDSFVCPYSNCNTKHVKKGNFRAHTSRYHRFQSFPEHLVLPRQGLGDGASPSDEVCTAQFDDVPELDRMESTDKDNLMDILDQVSSGDEVDVDAMDPFPEYVVKDEVIRFYMKLEGSLLLASSSVQSISEEIGLITELSHHSLKRALRKEMSEAGIDGHLVGSIIKKSFIKDPVFNIHHKLQDVDQVSTAHLRKKLIKQRFPYVEPIEIQLGKDDAGKPRVAQYIPLRETLNVLLKDPKVHEEVLLSFSQPEKLDDVLDDFRDGSAYKEHKRLHSDGKCLQILMFQDGFEFSPFGPAKGLYKSVGMYYSLGNISPEYRSKVDMIQLSTMIQERNLKPTEEEYLASVNKFEVVLQTLIAELQELQTNGIDIDGNKIPVCLLFCCGDNLGSHQIGSFIQSFNAMFTCRFCPISKTEFLADPSVCLPLRSCAQYDEYVGIAKEKWLSQKRKALKDEQKRRKKETERVCSRVRAPGSKQLIRKIISKAAFVKLRSISYRGVKPQPSALNKLPNFHVSSPSLPPCIAHDLLEGCINTVLAKILKHFIVTKEWFTLDTLNRRIRSFKCKGTDAADAPNPIASFDGIKGHACENWTLLRLLPFIIGDLIQDTQDEMFQLYLQLKEITEYVFAPKIKISQLAYLKVVIQDYLCGVKRLLPECLTPKHHYLRHYPDLILVFGPLIRLFTLRFESKHVFFKNVARACKNFINITYTLAQKYQMKFAFDHSCSILPPNVMYDSASSRAIVFQNLPADIQTALSDFPDIDKMTCVDSVVVKGMTYKKNLWFVLDKTVENNLSVGQINMILCSSSEDVYFVLRQCLAENTYAGYYCVENPNQNVVCIKLQDLPDYYPLPSYSMNGKDCLSLKHSLLFM